MQRLNGEHITNNVTDSNLMSRALVSIVIPCYNAQCTIGEALESVLLQTWPLIEIIVVNDGSIDNSKEVVSKYPVDRVALISIENQGAAAARNRGLESASGEWCVFLDADDLFEPRFIEVQLATALSANADICFGDSAMTWPDGRRLVSKAMPNNSTVDFALSRVLSDGWYPPHAILWRTSFVRGIGGWDSELRRNDDGELIARALLKGARLTASSGAQAIYRQHDSPNRVSARKDWAAIESKCANLRALRI